MSLHCERVSEIALDIWRIGLRIKDDRENPRLLAAWERADDRIRKLGFVLDTMVDRLFDDNLRVRVVDNEPCVGPKVISECLTPAVFFNGILIREAEVVTRGGL